MAFYSRSSAFQMEVCALLPTAISRPRRRIRKITPVNPGSIGWWHNPRFLAATGKGLEIEEGRAWEGWWNEKIVSLVELSAKQKNTLTVLLTGRSVKGYSGLIQRMIASKNLEFEAVTLKPETGPNSEHLRSTILFKCMFLEDVLNTYPDVEEVR